MSDEYVNLNEQIVLALGWKAVKVDPPIIYEGHDAIVGHYRIVCEWTIVDANGEQQVSPWQTEELAWEHVGYPDFENDANATLAVCAARGWYLSFTRNSALIAYDIGGGFSRTHRGDGETPQEAAARALLAALTATADAGGDG